MDEKTTQGAVVKYYSRPGSRIGYNLVMKGSKHFGYYDKKHTTEPAAQLRFLEKIAELLDIRPGMKLLDAGCGQGVVACYLASEYDVELTGLTIVPFETKSASRLANKQDVVSRTKFLVGDYADPPFKAESFDRIYAIETLSHAPDVALVIGQFMNLLKPGGELVCVEYELDYANTDEKDQKLLDFFMKYGALHGIRQFDRRQFMSTLTEAGFTKIKEYDWTEHMLPSFRRLRRLARPVAPVVKALRLNRFSINTIAASAYADWTEQDKFSFKAYTAKKTTRKTKK